jgi:hypothetical protein
VLLKGSKSMLDRLEKLEARPADQVELDFDLDADTRTLVIKSGAASKSFALRIPADKGVYKQGTAYSAGDCVTHMGSYWICKEFTSASPGKSSYWRLVAKRGRDGKDAIR